MVLSSKIQRRNEAGDGAGDGGGGGLSGEDVDRFSDLPESVTSHIMSFLDDDVIDVIKSTSLVARKWRHLWTSMTCLDMDFSHRVWSNRHEKYDRYKDFVDWVLMSRDSSIKLERSSLFYYNYLDDYTIHRWINLLSQRGVKTVCLAVGVVLSPVDLPHSLLTCTSLLELTLQFCPPGVLNLPTLASLSMLETLCLQFIEFPDSVLLRNFISSCPRLENLSMEECEFHDFEILDIRSTTLKTLTIANLSTLHCDLNVACPSLVHVIIVLLALAGDFTFRETNCLRKADIYLKYPPDELATIEHYRTLMHKIITQLSKVEVFKLTLPFCDFLNLPDAEPDQFAISFNNLKSLSLCVGMNKWYMQFMMNMLNCSPILETLEVYFNTDVQGLDPWNRPNDVISCLRNHLKTVWIYDFDNIENEVEFVRFLLEHGQKLQKMSIVWKGVEKSEEIMQQIKELAVSSSSVAVTFHDRSSCFYGCCMRADERDPHFWYQMIAF